VLIFIKLLLQKFHHQNNFNNMNSFIKSALYGFKLILVISLFFLHRAASSNNQMILSKSNSKYLITNSKLLKPTKK